MKKRVAVIGGGLGGMTAAGELAAAGCEVSLFEGTQALGGKARSVRSGATVLDTGPTLLTMPHLVRGAFERMGAADLLPPFIELKLQSEYRYHDGASFRAYSELERTADSARALGPGEDGAVQRFYEEAAAIHRAAGEPYLEAPFEGMMEFMLRVSRRGASAVLTGMRLGTLQQMAERHFATAHLQNFAGRFATYAGASPFQASAAFSLIPHLERVLGVHHVQGGMGALTGALERTLQRLGVRIELGMRAQWRRNGRGFLVGPENEPESFDAVVVNADPLHTLGRSTEPLALSGYVLLLEADRRLELPHHLVMFSRDYRREFSQLFSGQVPDDPTIYVCHPAATDPSMAAQGRSGLFVMVNAPALPADQEWPSWERHAAALREICLETLRRLCPETAGAQFRVLGERTPVDLAGLGAPGGSIYGAVPHGRFGPFRRPRIRGQIPGLFFSGGGAQPGGGVPLVMLSGHFAAQMVQAHLRGEA